MVKNTQVKRLEEMCNVMREFKEVHPILFCYLPHFIANMQLMAIKLKDYRTCKGKRRKKNGFQANPGNSRLSSVHFLLLDSMFREDHQRCDMERFILLQAHHPWKDFSVGNFQKLLHHTLYFLLSQTKPKSTKIIQVSTISSSSSWVSVIGCPTFAPEELRPDSLSCRVHDRLCHVMLCHVSCCSRNVVLLPCAHDCFLHIFLSPLHFFL